jgi:hypothetical protein
MVMVSKDCSRPCINGTQSWCVFVRGTHVLLAPYTRDSSSHHSVEIARISTEKADLHHPGGVPAG